jgi:hypothetical protein
VHLKKNFFNLVERGCGDKPLVHKHLRYLSCTTQICNDNKDYDNALFCLKKEKDGKEFKELKNCEKECFIHRHTEKKWRGKGKEIGTCGD